MMRSASLRALAISCLVLAAGSNLAEDAASGIRSEGDVTATAESGGLAVIQTGDGTIVVQRIDGISLQEYQKISAQLGVTESALASFFEILERNRVPPADLDRTLREIATRYTELDQKLAKFTSEDPAVAALKRQARAALEAGAFARTETLLNEAKETDIAASKEMQQAAYKRLLSAAESAAELGELKSTELAYAKAASYYREAVDLVPTEEELVLADYLIGEGSALGDAGEYRQAEQSVKRALDIRERVLGKAHPDLAISLNDLALLYRDQGRYAEAEPLFERAFMIFYRALGTLDPMVIKSATNLAQIYSDQGRYEEAEPLFKRALGFFQKAHDSAHPDVARSLHHLASLYGRQSRYLEAESLFKRAVEIWENTHGSAHPGLANSLNNLAHLYIDQGRYAEAEPLSKRALGIWEKILGPKHPDVALALNNLATVYSAQGIYAEAEPLLKRAVEIWEKTHDSAHPGLAKSLYNLAGLYYDQNRYLEAEPLYKRAVESLEKALGPKHPNVATSLDQLARLYYKQSRYAEAEPLFKQALEIREKALGSEHPDVASSLNSLAKLYYATGNYRDAEPRYLRAIEISEKNAASSTQDHAWLLNNLGLLYTAQDRHAEAKLLYERALGIYHAYHGPEPRRAVTVRENYEALLAKANEEFCVDCISRATLEPLVDEYTELSGLKHFLSIFPEQFAAMFSEMLIPSENTEAKRRASEIVKEAFEKNFAKQTLRSYLLQHIDRNSLVELLAWHRTPLAREIANAVIASSSPDLQPELVRYVEKLRINPLEPERLTIMQELDKSGNFTNLFIDLMLQVFRSIAEGVNNALPEKQRQAMKNIDEEIEKVRSSILESAREELIFTNFYTYRNITNDELSNAVKFYKSPTGQQDIEMQADALAYVLKKWSFNAGEKMLLLLSQEANDVVLP